MQKKAFQSCGYPKENPQNPTKPTNRLPKFSGTPNIRKLSLATRRSRNRVKMGDPRLPSTYIKSQHGNTESGTPTIPRLKRITPQRTNDRLPTPSIIPSSHRIPMSIALSDRSKRRRIEFVRIFRCCCCCCCWWWWCCVRTEAYPVRGREVGGGGYESKLERISTFQVTHIESESIGAGDN